MFLASVLLLTACSHDSKLAPVSSLQSLSLTVWSACMSTIMFRQPMVFTAVKRYSQDRVTSSRVDFLCIPAKAESFQKHSLLRCRSGSTKSLTLPGPAKGETELPYARSIYWLHLLPLRWPFPAAPRERTRGQQQDVALGLCKCSHKGR